MLLDQLPGCETTPVFMIAKTVQGKYLCYFPWFSQNKIKKRRNVCLHLQRKPCYPRARLIRTLWLAKL